MILANYAWERSFTRVELSKKTIEKCGLALLNHNILLDTPFYNNRRRAGQKKYSGMIISFHTTVDYVKIENSVPNFDHQFLFTSTPTTDKLNLKDRILGWYIDNIVQIQELIDS